MTVKSQQSLKQLRENDLNPAFCAVHKHFVMMFELPGCIRAHYLERFKYSGIEFHLFGSISLYSYSTGGCDFRLTEPHLLKHNNTDRSQFFLVALGIHNSVRWCDIVVDQQWNNTCMEIHPTYYNKGPRYEMLWKQLASLEKVNAQGESIKVDFYQENGSTHYATITIS